METIYMQRQGVSESLRAWFRPCPHGERHHLAIALYVPTKLWFAAVSHPNCFDCYGNRAGQQKRRWDGFVSDTPILWDTFLVA